MKRLTAMIVVFVFFTFALPVGAFSSVYGPTGLVTLPTTELLEEGKFRLNYFNLDLETNRFNFVYGVLSQLELGVNVGISEEVNELSPHIKGVLIEETEAQPSLAVGLVETDLYIMAGKALGFKALDGYFGVGTGKYSTLMLGVKNSFTPLVIGDEDDRIELPYGAVSAEYVGDSLNLGLEVDFSQNFGGQAALMNILDDASLMFGLQYSSYF